MAPGSEHPGFPDIALKQNVAATLQTLRDKIPLWHGTMPQKEPTRFSKPLSPDESRIGAAIDCALRTRRTD